MKDQRVGVPMIENRLASSADPRLVPPFSAENPFSASCVQPGAVEFLLAADDWQALWGRLATHRGPWQMVGPHGVGKTTLARQLVRHWSKQGQPAAILDARRRRPAEGPDGAWWLVDAIEGASRWTRWRWKREARRRAQGLILLSHHDVGVQTLIRLEPKVEVLHSVVAHLTHRGDANVTREDVAASFERAEGNLRKALFLLYDIHERNSERTTTLDRVGRTTVTFDSA